MKKPHLHECGLACKLKFVDPLDLAHHYLVGHHSPALVERDGFLYCGECFDVFKDTQKSQYDTHVKHGKHLVCPKDKRAFPSANKISYEFHIKQNHSLQCHECALSFLPADRLLFDKHKDVHKVSEVKSEPDKMEPCLVDEFLVEEKEAKSRVPRLDTNSAKITCEAMAEKVKDEVVAAGEEDGENNIRVLKADVQHECADQGSAEEHCMETETQDHPETRVEHAVMMESSLDQERIISAVLVKDEAFGRLRAEDTESEIEDDAVEVTDDLDYDFEGPAEETVVVEDVKPIRDVEASLGETEIIAPSNARSSEDELGCGGDMKEEAPSVVFCEMLHATETDQEPKLKQESNDPVKVESRVASCRAEAPESHPLGSDDEKALSRHKDHGSSQVDDDQSEVEQNQAADVKLEEQVEEALEVEQVQLEMHIVERDEEVEEVELALGQDQDEGVGEEMEEKRVDAPQIEHYHGEIDEIQIEISTEDEDFEEVQLAHSEEASSPDGNAREPSPSITIMSDSEPEVTF